MIKPGGYKDTRCEEALKTITDALVSSNYKVTRMSNTSEFNITNAYDCLIVKDWKWPGSIFTIAISNEGSESCYSKIFNE